MKRIKSYSFLSRKKSDVGKASNLDGALMGPLAMALGAPACGNVPMMTDLFPGCLKDKEKLDINQNEITLESANKITEAQESYIESNYISVPVPEVPTINQDYLKDNESFSLRLHLAKKRFTKTELSSGLFEAAFYGSKDCCLALLEHGADPDIQLDHHAGTPLCNACMGGHHKVVMLLIEHGCDLNLVATKKGYTALHYAAEHGNVICLEILLQRACDINVKNHIGETAYSLLTKKSQRTPEQDKCVEMFNSYNSKLKVPFQENGLHSACEVGDLKMTESLLTNKDTDVNEMRKKDNASPLVIAVKKQNVRLIRLLMTSSTLDVNIHCNNRTAMHWAILSRNLKSVLLLLKAGFNINAKHLQSFESSLLMLAIQIREKLIVETLCIFSENISKYCPCESPIKALAGMSPLMMAFHTADKDLINSLLDLGADIKKCRDFESVLSEAHKHNEVLLMDTLACYYMGLRDLEGHTLLTKATEMENLEMTQMLLNCGTDVNAPNASNMSALAIACQKKNQNLVDLLLKFGAKPNKFGTCKGQCKGYQLRTRHVHRSSLMISCTHNNAKILRSLLKFGADPNFNDPCLAKKPLLWAIETRQCRAIIRELVLAGADISSIFNHDSPVLAAIRCRNMVAFKILLGSNCQLSHCGQDVVLDENPVKEILSTSSCDLKVLLVACACHLYRRVVLRHHSIVTFGEVILKLWSRIHTTEMLENYQDCITLLENLRMRVFTLQEMSVRVIRDCMLERVILKGDFSILPCSKHLVELIRFNDEAKQFFHI